MPTTEPISWPSGSKTCRSSHSVASSCTVTPITVRSPEETHDDHLRLVGACHGYGAPLWVQMWAASCARGPVGRPSTGTGVAVPGAFAMLEDDRRNAEGLLDELADSDEHERKLARSTRAL